MLDEEFIVMIKLIYNEMIKLFTKKKNLILLLCMILLIGGYVKTNLKYDIDVDHKVISNYKQSMVEIGLIMDDVVKDKTKLVKEGREDSQQYKELLDEEHFLCAENLAIADIINGYRNNNPNEELQGKINLDTAILECRSKGYRNAESLKCEVLQQRNIYERRINKNRFLLNNNIEQINEETSMKSFNFLRLISKSILPLMIIMVSLLVAADSVSSENEEGTFKFVLIGRIKRSKIIIAKIISCTLFSSLIIFISILVYFIYLGFVKGFGQINYPFEYCKYSFDFAAANVFAPSYDIMPGIQYFIINILFTGLTILVTTVIGILLSTVLLNSKSSIAISIILGLVMYKLSNPFGILKNTAFLFPSTYFSCSSVLSGDIMKNLSNKYITFNNGVIVLFVFSAILITIIIRIFKKQDIKC